MTFQINIDGAEAEGHKEGERSVMPAMYFDEIKALYHRVREDSLFSYETGM